MARKKLLHLKSSATVTSNGSTVPKLPTSEQIELGEIAINYADGYETLAIKNSNGEIIPFTNSISMMEYVDNAVADVSGVTPVQVTGDSTTDVMSQSAVTSELSDKLSISDFNTYSGNVDTIVGSGFSQSSITEVIVSNERVIASAFNDINERLSGKSDIGHTHEISAVTGLQTALNEKQDTLSAGTGIDITDDVISVTGGVSITVDEVLDETTSASTNPIATKAVYSAITDNELVWTNAYISLSGIVSSHTSNTSIHMTSSDRDKLDSITGTVGTMAYEDADSYSSATAVNTALEGKVNTARTITATSGLTGGGALSSDVTISHITAFTEGGHTLSGNQNASFGETFNIPVVEYDAYGHITAVTSTTVTMPEGGGGFYTPTLQTAPDSGTTAYTKDGETVEFEIGNFCRVEDQTADSGYRFYQLYDLSTENNVTTAVWQVVDISTYDIQQLTLPDGEIDPDDWEDAIAGKEDRTTIVSVSSGTASISAEIDKYYDIAGSVGTLAVTLPEITGATTVSSLGLNFTTGSTPNVTLTAAGGATIAYYDGYQIEALKSYEINCMWNGTKWIVAYGVIS